MSRKNQIVQLNRNNYKSLIEYINAGYKLEWNLLLAFKHENLEENLTIIRELNLALFKKHRIEFLKDLIVICDFEYLANDFGVRGILVVDKVDDNIVKHFITSFNQLNKFYPKIEDFLVYYGKKNKHVVDIYNNRGPWLMSVGNMGILFINERTYNVILDNYHKRKNLTPDIIVVSFNGDEYDVLFSKLLKMIGSDGLIIFGITSKKSIPYHKKLDGLIYSKSPFKEDYMRKFLIEMLQSKDFDDNFVSFRDFLGIKPKNFDVDIWWDEDEEIKEEKYMRLKLLVFDRDDLSKIDTGFIGNRLTVVRKKKGAFKGKSKVEALIFEILEKE
ncbi:hypothetical protein [Fusobacterium sp. PH5-44]|uniref:hypothetical protein n=1 Tax=unclassified Fusobacterium TaxID=2648384 RepID=UPI003D1D2533